MSQYSQGGILEEFKGAFSKPDNALIQIILINLVVFLSLIVLRLFLPTDTYYFFRTFLVVDSDLSMLAFRPWTIFSYFITHESIGHIFWNMFLLYIFGRLVKEFLGNSRVLGLYVLGGLAGAIVFLVVYNLTPSLESAPMLGASAGVLAVVVGAATFMPNYTIFLIFLGPVRIKFIALFAVISSAYYLSMGVNEGGELAHLGGAALGFVFIKQLQAGNDWSKPVTSFTSFIKSFFVHQPKMKVTDNRSKKSKTRQSAPDFRPQRSQGALDQDEIDAILDKISQSGYDSLTKDEKEQLFNASNK